MYNYNMRAPQARITCEEVGYNKLNEEKKKQTGNSNSIKMDKQMKKKQRNMN